MLRGFVTSLALFPACLCAAGPTSGLDIYFIDMVGGASTFIVTPAGESILVDSGQRLARDADRIYQVVHDVAGISRIDHLVTTHWHLDHYGAVGLLTDRLAFGAFYDRGIPDDVPEDPAHYPTLIGYYKKACGNRSVTLRAGDVIPLKQPSGNRLTLRCLMASGKALPDAPRQSTPNTLCDQHHDKPVDTSDNGKSVALLLSFGAFDFFNPGDLTCNFEKELVCPVNRVGQIELLMTSHHGLNLSNNPVMIHALRPRTAVMCNGPTKGGDPEVLQTLRTCPGLTDFWQLHRNTRIAESENAPRERVANWDNPDGGRFIKVSVDHSGERFTVRIGAAGSPVTYDCWK
jgi:competence protein ComEC